MSSTTTSPRTPPLAVPAKEAARLLSLSLSKLYELLRNNELQSYIDGYTRRVTMASIYGYVDRKLADSGDGWQQITPQPRSRQQALRARADEVTE